MKQFIAIYVASSVLSCGPSWSQPRDAVRTHEDRVRELKGVLHNYRAPLPATVGGEPNLNNGAAGASRVAAQVVLSRVLSGEMTATEAWQKKLLSLDDITWILSDVVDAWGGFDWKKNLPVRRELSRLAWEQGGAQLHAQALAPKVLSRSLRLWLADYVGSIGDARVLAICEQILKETPLPVTGGEASGDKPLVFQTVERIGWFHRDKGRYGESAAAWLRLPSMYANQGWWPAAAYVVAARMTTRAGEPDKADKLYALVPHNGDAWSLTLVTFDRARELMNRKKHAEARQMLTQAIADTRDDESKAAMLALLSYSYRLTGEWEQARQKAKESMQQSAALPDAKRTGNSQGTENLAQSTFKEVDGWLREPIQVEPRELVITIVKGSMAPVVRRLHVRTLEDAPLKVTSNTAAFNARIVTGDGWGSGTTKGGEAKEVVVEITPDATLRAGGHELVISSPDTAFQARVPVQIEVR